MGLIKKLGSFLINFSIFFLIVTFSPGLPPKTTFPFEEFSFTKPQSLVGALESNELLKNPVKLFEGKLPGPEHLMTRDGAIFTALGNGEVVKIVGDKITVLGKFGKLCYEGNPRFVCGRPLGMSFDTISENIIVLDTTDGVFELNIKNGEKKQFVSDKTVIGSTDARPVKFFNSVTVAKNGDIYFTDSTSDFGVDKVLNSFIANPSGRLIHYSRKSGKLTVLVDKLWFANGVALSPEEDFILVCDLLRSKIMKVWLKSDKAGKVETFIEGLPGTPDNLTPDENGFYAALALTNDSESPYILQSLAPMPRLRKFCARILSLVDLLFTTIDKIYPNDFVKSVAYSTGSLGLLHSFQNPRATILRIDWKGNVIAAYHSFDGSLYTHAMELDGHLYLGSFTQNYIAKVVKQKHL